jgi:hypothetical protein
MVLSCLLRAGSSDDGVTMPQEYLDHQLECPFCHTIRLRIPAGAHQETKIYCEDCGEFLGTWDELQTDFERQGGHSGVFQLDKGKINRLY